MTLTDSIINQQNTADNLGERDTKLHVFKRVKEKFRIEEGATKVTSNTEAHTWIAGSATNSVVGTWTGTYDGSQLTVGSGMGADVLQAVANKNNIHKERFYNTQFKDTVNTDANWDIVNNRLSYQ